GEKMKTKLGMRALSLLLILALTCAIFVPAVSAEEQKNVSSESISERLIITPIFDDQEIRIKAPLDESEIVSFIFSEKWLMTNNENKDSEFIKVIVPINSIKSQKYTSNGVSDLRSIGNVENNDRVVLLQIPKSVLEYEYQKSDQTITLDYPDYCFSDFSDIEELVNEVDKRKFERDIGQNEQIEINLDAKQISQSKSSILYAEWACYNTNWFQYPKALRGDMDPQTFSYQGMPACDLYHEREIYLDRKGDTIELLLWYRPNGDIYLSAPLYDEGQLNWGAGGVPSSTWIDASSKNRFYYEFYVGNNGQYNINFLNTGTGIWYDYTYNDGDNPSSYIKGLTGSSELTLYAPVTDSFLVTTENIRDYGVKDSVDGSWITPASRFYWDQYKYKNNGLYVFMNSWISGGNIYTYHEACDTDT
ncbi:MAG: hypothetical protein JW931_08685, partial [Methanomicrobiaceae archaeon]|nr:hypothetical protein [Methanomicrobiaceae archaeon]